MVPDIINYKESFLNPGIKIGVALTFIIAAYFFFRSRNQYGGELGKVVLRLSVASVIGFLAMSFRYAGDFLSLWKWGESLGYAILGFANIWAAWPLLTYIKKEPTKVSRQVSR